MRRTLLFGILATLAGLGIATSVQAQVFVRAPFVRVQVGGPGVYVRAPFVNLWIPGGPPPPVFVPDPTFVPPMPAPVEAQPKPLPKLEIPPLPKADDLAPPTPVQPAQAPTLDQFANTFKAKGGNYEVTILNPVTKAPTTVRFTLPEGTPRRVMVRGNEIEFEYGLRRFVRIEFDKDGAQVITR